MSWIQISFWTCIVVLFYTFLGYGILLYFLVIVKRIAKAGKKPLLYNFEPPVTLVIPCFNEAEILADKIANCKSLEYPPEKLTIIFITDGSTDNSEIKLKAWPEVTVL